MAGEKKAMADFVAAEGRTDYIGIGLKPIHWLFYLVRLRLVRAFQQYRALRAWRLYKLENNCRVYAINDVAAAEIQQLLRGMR